MLGAIIAEAEQHSPRIIGDPWFPTIAYESNRVMLFYLTQVTDPVAVNKRDLVLSSITYLQSNLKALKTMRATNAMAEGLVSFLRCGLQHANQNVDSLGEPKACSRSLGSTPTIFSRCPMSSWTIRT